MNLPGILILNGNKTYGRNKKNKLLYKLIPNDNTLQNYLVPYEIKNLGFCKNLENLYVIFTLDPEPKLIEVIGSVLSNINFYEYQLFCHGLKQSLTIFKNKVIDNLKLYLDPIEEINKKYNLESRIDDSWYIFSIDPEGSRDIDDAFSIKILENNNYLISIYIANVPVWLDFLELNDDIVSISTIYLPNRKQPMLPNILSDDKCSLLENNNRIAFTLDLEIDNFGKIITYNFLNTLVNLKKNWSYDDPKLLLNKNYIMLIEIVKKMNNEKNIDSHKLVEILMIKMNCICGKILFENKLGIFRKVAFEPNLDIPNIIPKNIANTIQIIHNAESSYCKSLNLDPIKHDILQLDSYIHITSPIRRVVDIINMSFIQKIYGLVNFSDKINNFLDKMYQDNKIDEINILSKKIRSLQNKCNLLNTISLNYEDTILEGYVINDKTFYIPEYKLQCKLPQDKEYIIYSKYNCKLYLFNDNDKLTKKIRVEFF